MSIQLIERIAVEVAKVEDGALRAKIACSIAKQMLALDPEFNGYRFCVACKITN